MSAPVATAFLSSRKPVLSDSEGRGYPGPTGPSARWVPVRARCASLAGMTRRHRPEKFSIFNHIKIYVATIFPFQNSYLYGVDDLERPHAPHFSRHCGGARAWASAGARGRGPRKIEKFDEQFCCGRAGRRQSKRRRRPAGQPPRATSRHALCRAQGQTRPTAYADPKCTFALRADEGVGKVAPRSEDRR